MTGDAMRISQILRLASLAFMLGLVPHVPASAQNATCQRIAADLASLDRSGQAHVQQAAGLRQQYAQIIGTLGQLGCDQSRLFGPQPPAQCAVLRQQASALVSRISQLENGGGRSETRRLQLQDAYAAHDCRGSDRPYRAAAPIDDGMPRYATPTLADERIRELEERGQRLQGDVQRLTEKEKSATRRDAARVPICVRTCDGFFFPVNFQGAEGQYADVCRASCPGANAEMYWMSGDGDLENAVSGRGARYTALPAAFKYRQALDQSCSCKSPQESWGRVLRKAEGLIHSKGDIVVTADSSQRLARPNAGNKELRGIKTMADPVSVGSTPDQKLADSDDGEQQPLPPLESFEVLNPRR